ncbi:steroid receptor RNA activator 1 [Procambarus clarkii]|uniref:steroid receptor RNA activator 1 n=1 Tax=Procambarus clarkii TaxID=6728 RepID=UPI001E6779D0|nr:steroid receptor RNA activator 1-like [Procambarus clarkii]
MDPIGPGNHERAWNDPPKFAYNASAGGAPGSSGGRRRLLNKRVAVPIGPTSNVSPVCPALKSSDTPPNIGSAPPRPPTVGPPPVPLPLKNHNSTAKTLVNNVTTEADIDHNPKEILEEVELSLNNSLQSIDIEIKHNIRDEISKRIHTMKTMWLDGKLNEAVQKRMLSLAKALDHQEYETAWTLHLGLIVDYTSLCSPWMVGVKTLIAECRNRSKCRANDLPGSAVQVLDTTGEGEENKAVAVISSVMAVGDISLSKTEGSALSEGDDNTGICNIVSGSINSTRETEKEIDSGTLE